MTNPYRLYVGAIGEGLFRSLDGGETFSRACDGMFVECHVRALAVHPQDPRTIFMGSEQGLYRTVDGADHWARVESPLNGLQIWSILLAQKPVANAQGSDVADAPGSDIIVVGTCPSRLFPRTGNFVGGGGDRWSLPKPGFRPNLGSRGRGAQLPRHPCPGVCSRGHWLLEHVGRDQQRFELELRRRSDLAAFKNRQFDAVVLLSHFGPTYWPYRTGAVRQRRRSAGKRRSDWSIYRWRPNLAAGLHAGPG